MAEIKEKSPIALRFEQLVDSSTFTQREIAKSIGFDKPNMITMLKQGLTKIPIDKIPAIAKLFGIDAAEFLKQAMIEYEPKKYEAIVKIIGEPIPEYEMEILKVIREEVRQESLKYDNLKYRERIRECLRQGND
jgi:transcriptional regulator with XRE-family HTH domain